MDFKEFRFVFIDTAYLKYLHNYDSEIFFSADTDYSKKPHLGILINCHGRKYVIPLTSAKRKHSEDEQRRNLMIKEYFFCKKIKTQIESKAKKIYERQIMSGIVAQYHCNYKLLESVADEYKNE